MARRFGDRQHRGIRRCFYAVCEESNREKEEKTITRIFDFIEELAGINDDYTKQLLMICIFDNLVFFDDEIDYSKWLKPKSKELFEQSQMN